MMNIRTFSLYAVLLLVRQGVVSADPDAFFVDEVWTKVGARTCLKCHKPGGDAEESEFILRDPARDASKGDPLIHNHMAFSRMARAMEDKESRLLLKVVGKLDHGGEDVLEPGSTRYKILSSWVNRVTGVASHEADAATATGISARGPFFEGVEMLDAPRLLRRLTLSLGARLPSADERAHVGRAGIKAIEPILDTLMDEEAFYDRLAEGFNDIFLTPGIDDVAENVLSYEHFDKTRHWYKKWDFSHIKDGEERKRAGWKLADVYRDAMKREPMEMVKYIVRNGRPFTEIVTADYIMVSPYTARGYGVFEEVRERFKNTEDPFEYIPVRLKALTGRSKKTNQESATGFYPHAGILSTFQYLKRYPTTETNRNRLRVRMYFEHFLGIDIMQLAPRVNDAAAITAKYEVPTMEAADCVVCHKIVDPIAGLFQDYYAVDAKGVFKRRPEGWFEDMFKAGHEGEALPDSERWRALQWLAERTVKDPCFAIAMVEHVWYILTGRRPLLPPEDIDDPLYAPKQRGYREQRKEIEGIAERFAAGGFDLKDVFKELAVSNFYRADGLAEAGGKPERLAELDDLGVVRLLSPEQLERKLKAIFGRDWGRLHKQFMILYGGIDTKEVTERIADPSGAMGAIQRMMANEVACKNVALDFAREPKERLLFPGIEMGDVPGTAEADAKIRATVVHLHERLLGRAEESEIDRTYHLFCGIIEDAKARGKYEPDEKYHCRVEREKRLPDPDYTLRAWRAVVTYLLRQQEFLYE